MNRLTLPDARTQLGTLTADPDRRVVVGVTGPPGAGKSTVARQLVDGIPGAVLVPMDGFHLAHSSLERVGSVETKGAPETFDAAGYVALLRRLREPGTESVWAPEFRREIEDAVAGAIEVPPTCRLIVTEGNYLLLDEAPWGDVRQLVDVVWFVDVPENLRHERLAKRHMEFGRDAETAQERTLGSDEANARRVNETRDRADALLEAD